MTRNALLLMLVASACVAGWRITQGMLADAVLASGDVESALRWQPAHPEALLQQAELALSAKRINAAATSARRMLQVVPTDGRGYRILAQVADAEGQRVLARRLFLIGARRAPRDLPARAWLAQDALERGQSIQALDQIDAVLTLSPSTGGSVFPIMVTLAADPAFAEALAARLQRAPAWRGGMLAALRQARPADREVADRVLSILQRRDGFDQDETIAWTESLIRNGRWGEAYARWASPLVSSGVALPLLFNGDFGREPSGAGFDWRMPPTPGVLLELEHGGNGSLVLHARFLGRRVAGAFLEHRLLLPPGRFQFQVRQRSDALRSDSGLEWTLGCDGTSEPLARTSPLKGTRDWATTTMQWQVPTTDCQGQWLRLANAGAAGAGQLVAGEAWIDDAVIKGLHADQKAGAE